MRSGFGFDPFDKNKTDCSILWLVLNTIFIASVVKPYGMSR